MIKEEFKGLQYNGDDFGDLFEISNLGNLRRKGNKQNLKLTKNKKGITTCCVVIEGKYKSFRIHRAVAATFIPNPDKLPYAVHLDGDKNNNRVDNLAWMDPKMSMEHTVTSGRWSPAAQDHLKKPVIMFDKETGERIKEFACAADAAIYLGDKRKRPHILQCCTGERLSAYGYIWKYLN